MAEEPLAEGLDTCYICHDKPTSYDKTTKLPCNHTFHTSCLHHWLQRKNNCPACRHKVVNHSRGMLLQEAASKTVLYAKTGAVTSTDADRSRQQIDTMTQSTGAMQLLDDHSRLIHSAVEIGPAMHRHIMGIANRGSENRTVWAETSPPAYNNSRPTHTNRHYTR